MMNRYLIYKANRKKVNNYKKAKCQCLDKESSFSFANIIINKDKLTDFLS